MVLRWRRCARVALLLSLLGCRGSKQPLLEAARAGLHEGELSSARPILNVRSLRASQAYFHDRLGFKVDWDHGDPPNFGSVSRGHAVLFMCEGCEGGGQTWVMLFTEDVDRLYEELRARDAIVRMPPTDMPWQLREMRVADLDGNVIRVAAAIEH